MESNPRLIIAGLKGGSGKTILSLGLARAWTEKGLKVVPFKKGPDYIDAGWLASAANSPCYNLDPFLIGMGRLTSSFFEHSKDADISIIEGNRGLFDGMDEEGANSTAAVAKAIKAPVVLIIDCSKVTRTVAALLLGAQKFDEEVEIKAVILNHIAGKRHEDVIRKSVEKYCSIPVLGAIPRLDNEDFPERHMGLTPFQEHPDVDKAIDAAAEVVKKYVDVEGLIRIAKGAATLEKVTSNELMATCEEDATKSMRHSSLRIGVVKDSAFQFYYPENLIELKRRGAEVIEISALKEKALPVIDALYIGGGFPETHAIALAENSEFRESLRKAAMDGLPVYAECGGLMYLGKGLMLDNRMYPMTGIFPLVFSLEKRPQAHGYSIIEVERENPFYSKGAVLKGHEFHYSKVINPAEEVDGLFYAVRMKRGQGIYNKKDGVCYKNVFATYTHLHAYGAEEWVEGMIRAAAGLRDHRLKTIDKD